MKQNHCNIPVLVDMKHQEHWWNVSIWLSKNIDKNCYNIDLYSFEHDGKPFNKRVWFAYEQDAITFVLKWL